MASEWRSILLHWPEEEIRSFVEHSGNYEKVRPCPICGYWDELRPAESVRISRDSSLLCVGRNSQDLER